MEEWNIDELNDIIKQHSFFSYFLPNNLEKTFPQMMCSPTAQNSVRKRIINNKDHLPKEYVISKNIYGDVAAFLLDSKIPLKEKEVIYQYLTEDLKEYIFKIYFEEVLKAKFKPLRGVIGDSYYQARTQNDVLVRYYYDKNDNFVINPPEDISLEAAENLLINKTIEISDVNCIAIRHLLEESGVIKEVWCPKYIKNILTALNELLLEYERKLYQKNDQVLHNHMQKVPDSNHQVHANKDLVKMILESIPNGYSNLEKAIYIYAKLWELLSYDSIYYIGNKQEHLVNNVVCYEFAYLFTDLLEAIGIKKIKETKGNSLVNEQANTMFLVDDLVLLADSTEAVTDSDFESSKHNLQLSGIKCELYDDKYQEKFTLAKDKVEKHLKQENKNIEMMIPKKEEFQKLSINERIILLNNILTHSHLQNSDFIFYARRLIEELQLNISLRIYYKKEKPHNLYMMIAIPTIEYNYSSWITYIFDTVNKHIFKQIDEQFIAQENVTYHNDQIGIIGH